MHLRNLGKPGALGLRPAAPHGVAVVVRLVVLDLLPLPGPGTDPVGSHVGLEVHALRHPRKLTPPLILVVIHRHSSVQGELDGRLRELLQLVVQVLRLLLSLSDNSFHVLVGNGRASRRKDLVRPVPDHIQQVLLLHRLVSAGVLQPALLDHERVQLELLVRLLDDLLFDGVLRAEPVHVNLLLLANSVSAVHGLQVHLRVPVRVVQDDDIGGVQVDSEATCPRGKQEGKLLRVGGVVRIDALLPVLSRGVSVNPAVLVPPKEHVVLEDVEQAGHLGEDKDARTLLLQPGQELVQQDHLSSVLDQMHVSRERRSRLGALEQVRVIAALPQLHHDVEQPAPLPRTVDGVDVLLHQVLVPLQLHLAHTNLQDGLLLGGQALLDLCLHPTQQERPQQLVQLVHGLVLLGVRVDLEPLIELFRAGKDVRQQKVEESPELVQVVLQRRTGDQQSVVRVEHPDDPAQQRVLVLDPVRLVDDDVPPVELLQVALLLDDHLVRSHADVELSWRDELLLLLVPLLLVAVELPGADHRAPPLELIHPVVQRGLGDDHKVWAGDSPELVQVAQERDRLQRFSQAHLVRQDAVDSVVVQVDHPIQALELVVAHGPELDAARLYGQSVRLGQRLAVIHLVLEELLVLLLLPLAAPGPSALARLGLSLALGVPAVHVHEMLKDVGLLQEVAHSVPRLGLLVLASLHVHLVAVLVQRRLPLLRQPLQALPFLFRNKRLARGQRRSRGTNGLRLILRLERLRVIVLFVVVFPGALLFENLGLLLR
mmetsp:Transcript_8845/g.30409  ORF Transcript_8845/g.30409 Transcript_8845/m.30409 type:complete len:769 (-) Transcript_8845:151-2457(-)